ncbi:MULTISPECIES: trypsin-like peptidase domain-containing protein [unclassified Streptomyces]|uniref:trypsin-like peptidase domain-containing protein n=1 Tax=unclassified Streptomyces TaxID=2593676 RepID=UPI002251AE69|nr:MULTISPECIES: trypsin-like peptidase domain-containing protein [unclassified Streptomyces]MCX5336541.1 trypsin-like peptidase domain-containing protein [Streptomyces sp. NBC_00140]MCX5367293.1 trypsin-like peptidase domain-containing protein [Streptomyces sp. NBC_00124]
MDSLAGRCAEVLVEQDGGTGYGSGLRLATSLVVTAGHVVEDGGPARVRLSGGGPDEIVVTGRTVWRGARLDVALVELAPVVSLEEVAPMAIGVVPDEADGRLPFTAIGFPRHQSWTDMDTATWRDSDQIDGVIPLGSSVKRGRLLLHRADGRRLEARDWSGFSGAGVVCEGSAVGVVVESAHSGGLEAVRLAAVMGAYEPRAEGEREPEPSATAARELLASHGVVPELLRGQERRRPAYEAMLRQYAARCAELTGRDRELADLLAFATGPDPYLLLVAGPWAGKTSLVTRFATGAHPGLDVVSFVISRRDGQMRVQQFHRAMCDQLAALLGEFPPAEPDAAAFLSLWGRAMRIPGRSLLLLVDGLDENDYRELAEPSIAAQLPTALGPAAHVLVTSRHSDVPLDVDGSHPLRTCRRQVLTPFAAATSLLLRARQELDHVLAEPVPRTVLTAMTVAGGALSSRDIASIVNDSVLAIRRTLERGLSRVVEPRHGTPTRYTLAHDTLVDAVREDLEPEEVAQTRTAIDGWALGFATAGWPDDTPGYLTEAYPTLLLTEGAGPTLAALASSGRRALLRRRTDGDLAALSELSNAARLLADAPDCDLALLTRVSLLRKRIENDSFNVPSEYPLLLVRLGRTEEGIQLARTLQNVYAHADALLSIGEHLLGSRPTEARNLIYEAMAVPGRLLLERVEHSVRAALVLARHGDPGAAELARRAVADSGDQRDWLIIGSAEALAEIDPALARTLIEEAIEHADAEDRPEFCGFLAPGFAALGELDRFFHQVSHLDRDDKLTALLVACGEHFTSGGRRSIPEELLTALNREFADTELVESAPYQDEDRAWKLLDLPRPDSPGHDPVRLTCTALAAHGHDPRQTGACDEFLDAATTSALRNGHLPLAISLAQDIASPFIRAGFLTNICLVLLDADTALDAKPLVREIEAALDETMNTSPPTLLAALARAACTAGRTDLARPALERAVDTLLQNVKDTGSTWEARAVAAAAAFLGHLDHTRAIAAAFEAEEFDCTDILLDAAKAVEHRGDHRSADLDLLIAQATERIERSIDPGVADWRTHDLIALHLRAGHTAEAMRLTSQLPETDLSGRTLKMRALLLSDHIPAALSLIRETAVAAQFPQELALRQEQAASMTVEMCDAGHLSLCRDLTAELARTADPGVTLDSGLWARPWLTAACQTAGLTEDFTRLLDTVQHAALVTGAHSGTETIPLEAVVRLRLWDRFHAESRRLNEVLAEGVTTDLVKAMLDAGLLTEALPLIDDLPGDAAYCLALAAATSTPPSADLVKRSLAHGFAEDVIAPLAALETACLQEIAAQLGVILPPAEQVTLRAPRNS